MRKLGAAPDYILGSAHAITDDGQVVVGSGSGSQLGAYALREYSLPREFLRMQDLGYPGSLLTKTLIIHQDPSSRTTVILVPETLGF
jgi:hypothetical protein